MGSLTGLDPKRRAYLMDAARKRASSAPSAPTTGKGSLSGLAPARRQQLMDAWRARKAPTGQENLYNPLAALSGDNLASAVKAAVDLQLAPQLGALDREQTKTEGINSALTRRTNDYYTQYQEAAKSGAAAQGQALQGISGANPDVVAGFGNVANTISNVTGMQAQDAQQLLAAQFAQQMGDLTSRRSEVEATRPAKTLEALTSLRQSQFDNAAVSSQLDLKAQDQAQTAQHQANTDAVATGRLNETVSHNSATEAAAASRLALDKTKFRETQRNHKVNESLAARRIRVSQGKTNKPQTPAQQQGVAAAIAKAKLYAEGFRKAKADRRTAAQKLKLGAPATKNPDGTPKAGARPAFDEIVASVALDLTYDNHISAYNRGLLKDLGIDPALIARLLRAR